MHSVESVDGRYRRQEETAGFLIDTLTNIPDHVTVDVALSLDEVKSATTPSIHFHGTAKQVREDLMAITQRRARNWL